MEKIQFKRANSAEAFGTLSVGEIGVVNSRQTKYRGIVIGTDYGNEYIRAYPYNSNYVVTDISLENSGTNPVLKVTKHQFDGTESKYDLDFVISGTIETANKLSSNAGSDTASKCQPIYFSGGKPTNIIQTRGGVNQPVYLNEGKIEAISATKGSNTMPVWLNNGKIESIDYYRGSCTGTINTQNFTTTTIKSPSISNRTDTTDYYIKDIANDHDYNSGSKSYSIVDWKTGMYCICAQPDNKTERLTFLIQYTKSNSYNTFSHYSTVCSLGSSPNINNYQLEIKEDGSSAKKIQLRNNGIVYNDDWHIITCQKIG